MNEAILSLWRERYRKRLAKGLERLAPREREILSLRLGLEGDRPHPLTEVAERFNLSREEVCEIEAEAWKKLHRHRLRENFTSVSRRHRFSPERERHERAKLEELYEREGRKPEHKTALKERLLSQELEKLPGESDPYRPRAEGLPLAELDRYRSPEERVFRSVFGEETLSLSAPDWCLRFGEEHLEIAKRRLRIQELQARPDVWERMTPLEAEVLTEAFGLEDERIRALDDLVLRLDRPPEEVYLHLDGALEKLEAALAETGTEWIDLRSLRGFLSRVCAYQTPDAFRKAHRSEPLLTLSDAGGRVSGLARLDRPAVSFSPLYHHDDDLLPFGRFLVYVYLTRPREGRPGVDLYPDVEEGRGVEVYLNWEDACLGFLNEVSGDPELGRQALEGREVLLRDERRSDVLETARLPLLDCFATYWSEEEWPLYAVSAVTEDEEGAREAHRRALQAEAKGFHLGRGYLARLPRSFPWP